MKEDVPGFYPGFSYTGNPSKELVLSKKFSFFGIRIFVSKYRWLTPFISTVNLRSPSVTSHLPKPVILFIMMMNLVK